MHNVLQDLQSSRDESHLIHLQGNVTPHVAAQEERPESDIPPSEDVEEQIPW